VQRTELICVFLIATCALTVAQTPVPSDGTSTRSGASATEFTPGTCSTGSTYSAALTVPLPESIQAIATKASYGNRSVVTGTYSSTAVPPHRKVRLY